MSTLFEQELFPIEKAPVIKRIREIPVLAEKAENLKFDEKSNRSANAKRLL